MVNQSKKNDPRFWTLWRESGAVAVDSLLQEMVEFDRVTQNSLNSSFNTFAVSAYVMPALYRHS